MFAKCGIHDKIDYASPSRVKKLSQYMFFLENALPLPVLG